MIRLRFSEHHGKAGKVSAAQRWGGEFAYEEWSIDPLWKMSVPDFLAHLVALYGAEYLEHVNYERTTDGRLVPSGSSDGAASRWVDPTGDPAPDGPELLPVAAHCEAASLPGATATRRAGAG